MEKSTQIVIDQIAAERQEQIIKHGKTLEHDLQQNSQWELKDGAVALLVSHKTFPEKWNKEACAKMNKKPYRDRLIIAAALLVAEIERIDYKEALKRAQQA